MTRTQSSSRIQPRMITTTILFVVFFICGFVTNDAHFFVSAFSVSGYNNHSPMNKNFISSSKNVLVESSSSSGLIASARYLSMSQQHDHGAFSSKKSRRNNDLVMSLFRRYNNNKRSAHKGLGVSRPFTSGGDLSRRSHLFKKIQTHSISKAQKVTSIVKKISRKTKNKLHISLMSQRKKYKSRLAAAAFAFSVFCVNTNNGLIVNKPSTPSQLSPPVQNHDTSLVTSHSSSSSSPLRISGGGKSGTKLMNDKNLLSRTFSSSKMNTNHRDITTPTHTNTLKSFHKEAKLKNIPMASVLPRNIKNQNVIDGVTRSTSRTLRSALDDLFTFMAGPKSDTLLLLLATALITPICKKLGTSPILGFLAAGMLLGPNGCGLITGIHNTETLAELGIVFFLFEMGIELSVDRLMSMKKDVFGLGALQFAMTALAVSGVAGAFTSLSGAALVVLGGGLALSSSAFVLQLLKDKNQLASRFGKASFGVLLFQDLAVVPLLVVTPILAGGGSGLASALSSATIKATMALGSIAFAGRVILNPLFKIVAGAQSQEAFLGVVLLTVLSMSFLTEGLGLSNTLGAFLAGVLLSETKYRFQIEADIAPFRGILLGLFFVTVGFEIDLHLIASNFPLIGAIVLGIVAIKALITTLLGLAFGLSLATSQQTGLILSQGKSFSSQPITISFTTYLPDCQAFI